jgi:hypothetical protein
MRRSMRRRPAALLLAASLVASACGGAAPVPPDGASAPPAPGATTATSASPGATPPGVGPSGPIAVPAPDAPSLNAALARPVEIANATGDMLARDLVDASGLTAALGPGAGNAIAALLDAEHAATRAEIIRRGGDPDALSGAVRRGIEAAIPGRASLAKASMSGTAGFLALSLLMVTAPQQFAESKPDSKGRVSARFTVETTVPGEGGGTMTFHETTIIDLSRCPDPAGVAAGTVSFELDFSASAVIDGTAHQFTAHGVFAMNLAATATANADLADVSSTVTGSISTTTSDGTDFIDFDGVGGRLPIRNGTPDADGAEGWGHYGGTTSSAADLSTVMQKMGWVFAWMNGTLAEKHWSSGKCVRLEVAPPDPRVAGDGEALDVTVTAISNVDEATVQGRLAVTPVSGTITPTTTQTPASLHVTVAPGDTSADATLELRSLRGVAKVEAKVLARGYEVLESFGTMTVKGRKCDGPVGTWHLVVGGKASQDGFSVAYGGSIDVTIKSSLTGTYRANVKATAENLPPQVTAALGFSGGGRARFSPEQGVLEFLDGAFGGAGTGSGPNLSVNIPYPTTPSGSWALPVSRAPCGQ